MAAHGNRTTSQRTIDKEHEPMTVPRKERFHRRVAMALLRSRLTKAGACSIAAGLAAAAPAAALDVTSFTAGSGSSQAGAHSDFVVSFGIDPTMHDVFPIADPFRQLGRVVVELPPGVIGEAARFPECSATEFAHGLVGCPPETRVGEVEVVVANLFGGTETHVAPLNVLEAGKDQPARLGFTVGGAPTYMNVGVRSGSDYGLTTTVADILPITVLSMKVTLWGKPADHGTGGPDVPFMTNPTECGTPLVTTLRVTQVDLPNQPIVRTSTSGPMAGCENIEFRPNVQLQPENPVADKPSALRVGIGIPDNPDPDGLAAPALRRAAVQLPAGVTINPSLAHDRVACDDGAFARNSDSAVNCPVGSKIGTIGIDVPALRAPLPGDIYLGTPKNGDPFRLFLYAEGQGVRVKLEGSVQPDPKTGQLTTVFNDTPQVPFRSFNLRFTGGDRAALLMPETCGTKTGVSALTPYSSSEPTVVGSTIQINGGDTGCPEQQPFSPSFEAGVTNAGAGQDTGFTVKFGRPDGNQMLSKLKLKLPAGLQGRLAAFPLCPNAKADAGDCSDDSLVGGVTVSAGSGNAPLNVPGKVYLTEPPKPGQIAGLSIVVPAIAGPYNLGTPVVRAGITVNPDTSLTVDSDPLPTILAGVPLRIKQVIVTLDRQGFMLNPTDCSPKAIEGTLTSVGGVEAPVSSPFGVSGCGALPFDPPFTVGTAMPSKTGGVTGIRVNLGGVAGHSNARQVQVVLPKELGSRLEGPIQSPCTETDFAEDKCAEGSRIGTAEAKTPLLPDKLAGPVYFLENKAGGLPKLAVRLKGAITLDVLGDVALTGGGRIVTTFPAVPDVPLNNFELVLEGGDKGVLTAARMCGKKPVADVVMIGHSGKQVTRQTKVDVIGCGTKAASKSKHRRPKHKAHKTSSKGR
jgi:hypothetical protein